MIKFRVFGERAIELVWPQKVSQSVLTEIRIMSEQVRELYGPLVEDLIPTYANLLIVFSKLQPWHEEIENLRELYLNLYTTSNRLVHRWYIPVCYEKVYGLDIDEFCKAKHITTDVLIGLHSKRDYPIHFYGFLPGFFYLGGLDGQLHYPRKRTPRLNISEGSVAIGGTQTGVYPQDSPGGWHVIGATPVKLFDPSHSPPVFAEAGDMIHFEPVGKKEFDRIKKVGEDYTLRKEVVQ